MKQINMMLHESMAFQFMDKIEQNKLNLLKKMLLNENGILIIEEKFLTTDSIYEANEELKNNLNLNIIHQNNYK